MAFIRWSGVQELGHRLASSQVITESGVAIMEIVRCSGVQGERGMSIDFMSVALRWVSKTGALAAVLASVFNNGWIMILFEQMPAPSPSAADSLETNRLKTEHNSFVANKVSW